jgi:hypothetical protein
MNRILLSVMAGASNANKLGHHGEAPLPAGLRHRNERQEKTTAPSGPDSNTLQQQHAKLDKERPGLPLAQAALPAAVWSSESAANLSSTTGLTFYVRVEARWANVFVVCVHRREPCSPQPTHDWNGEPNCGRQIASEFPVLQVRWDTL